MKILFLPAVVCLFLSYSSFSQEESRWVIHVGATIPSGDFAADDIDKVKSLGAALGFGINVEYIYPLNSNGLGLFFGVGFNYNGMKSDVKDDIVDHSDFDEDDITFPKYFTLPVSSGLNYRFQADEKLSLFANLGLVMNFLKITDYSIDFYDYYGDYDIEYTQTHDISSNLGYKIGGGIIINDKTYISLNYIDAGKQKIKYKYEYDYSGGNSGRDNFKSKISYLTLTVGFRL